MQRHQEERLTAVEPEKVATFLSDSYYPADRKRNLRKNQPRISRFLYQTRKVFDFLTPSVGSGRRGDRPMPGIQATCFRLRQRMKAAPPASKAAAVQVLGSGTGSGPAPIAVVRRGQPDQGHRSTAGTNPHISPGEICAASKFLLERNLARPTGKNGKTKVVVPFSDGVNPGRPDDIRLYRPSGRIFHAMHEISGLRHGKL
jgi:hypothetical protein